MESPTFTPSLLIRRTEELTNDEIDRILDTKEKIVRKDVTCHLFIKDGKIEYLVDCTHKYAGQIVPMEPF